MGRSKAVPRPSAAQPPSQGAGQRPGGGRAAPSGTGEPCALCGTHVDVEEEEHIAGGFMPRSDGLPTAAAASAAADDAAFERRLAPSLFRRALHQPGLRRQRLPHPGAYESAVQSIP